MSETPSLESKEFSVTHRRRRDQLPGGRHGIPREVVAESQRDRILKGMTIAAGRHARMVPIGLTTP